MSSENLKVLTTLFLPLKSVKSSDKSSQERVPNKSSNDPLTSLVLTLHNFSALVFEQPIIESLCYIGYIEKKA
jgi:hypothetical protein